MKFRTITLFLALTQAASACNTTVSTCCDLPPLTGCKGNDTSAVTIAREDPSELGFSADELARFIDEAALPSGTWRTFAVTDSPSGDVRVEYTPDPNAAELVQRPAGTGFSRYTQDRSCPAGPLLRMPLVVSFEYEYEGLPVRWVVSGTVEAQALSGDLIFMLHELDQDLDDFDPSTLAMFTDAEANLKAEGKPNPPKESEREGLWVNVGATPQRGSLEIKARWTTGLSTLLATYSWTDE